MTDYAITNQLKEWLIRSGHANLANRRTFKLNTSEFNNQCAEVYRQHPSLALAQVHDRAALRCITLAEAKLRPAIGIDSINVRLDAIAAQHQIFTKHLFIALAVIAVILVLSNTVFGQGITVVGGSTTDGIALRGNAVVVGGLSSGLVQSLSVDSTGALNITGTVTTSLNTSGMAVSVTTGASTSGVDINPSGGAVHSAAPVYTDGTIRPLSIETDGDLRVAATLGANSGVDIGDVTINNATITVDGTVTVTDGAGALNTIVDSGTLTAVTTITNAVTVTDGAGSLNVICDSGCGGGTTDTDDGTVAGGQTGGLVIGATYVWDGANWARAVGNSTDGITVNLGTNNDVTVTGSVTANAGTNLNTSALATSANQITLGSSTTKLNDGTDTALVTAGGLLQVDGSGVTQPVSGTVTVTDGAGALNVIVDSGTVTTVSTVTSVTAIANALPAGDNNIGNVDVLTIAAGNNNIGDVDATLAAETTKVIGTVRNLGNAGAAFDAATAAAPPANAVYVAGLQSGATGGLLGGIPVCDGFANVNVVTATTTLIITGVSGRQVYICGINLVTAAANNVAFVAGTDATCGTSTAGMNGGTTAATGWNFAANGGIAHGSGLGAVMRTETAGDSVCVITSAATQLSGTLSYVIY